jgi:hypothetical protein
MLLLIASLERKQKKNRELKKIIGRSLMLKLWILLISMLLRDHWKLEFLQKRIQ